MTIVNSGNSAATGVTFTDTPDPNTTLVAGSVTTNRGTVTGGNGGVPPVTVNIGTLPGGGASATISFRVTIDTPLPTGVTQVSNQGTVSATNHPAVPTNDPGTLVTDDPTITPVTAAPVLAATKTASVVVDAAPIGPSPGDTLQYIITIVNSGNGAATSVTFTDTPDTNTTLVVGTVTTNRGTVTGGN